MIFDDIISDNLLIDGLALDTDDLLLYESSTI